MHATAEHGVLSIRTALGKVRFGDCPLSADVTLSAGGRMWLDALTFGGGAEPCGDILPCAPPEVLARRLVYSSREDVPPWRGRLTGAQDGGFVGHLRFCSDNCLGRYQGVVRVTLERERGRWIMRARSAPVGNTPLEIDSTWTLTGRSGLSLRSTGQP